MWNHNYQNKDQHPVWGSMMRTLIIGQGWEKEVAKKRETNKNKQRMEQRSNEIRKKVIIWFLCERLVYLKTGKSWLSCRTALESRTCVCLFTCVCNYLWWRTGNRELFWLFRFRNNRIPGVCVCMYVCVYICVRVCLINVVWMRWSGLDE